MNHFLAVALGGAFGSVARYWLSTSLNKQALASQWHWLPLGTLSVNVIGSFLIGAAWAYMQLRNQNELFRLLVMVGLLGGFTTFSTFSLETLQLLNAGEWARAGLNVLLSVFTCLAAAAMGMALGRFIL
ncbi:MAG: fluoride efflux transporter CrcB [Arenicellales bacterium]